MWSFDWGDVAFVTIAAAIAYHWWGATGVKERALAAAQRHCREFDVQLLDSSVMINRLWVKKDAQGYWRLWRAYLFEFTATGEDRFKGRVITLGRRIEKVELEPHRVE